MTPWLGAAGPNAVLGADINNSLNLPLRHILPSFLRFVPSLPLKR